MDTTIAIGLVVLLIAAAIGAFLWIRGRRSHRLRKRFGPEYDRTVRAVGNRGRAEKELETREKRVETLDIRPLQKENRDRYADRWTAVQGRFVDEPSSAVEEADELVNQVMRERGYPMGDFEQRAADISVHYPNVVDNYRAAREIALRNRKGEATTEDLRQAVVYYRELFEELLGPERSREVPEKEEKHLEKEGVRR